ncbi:hypothetical protein [Anaerovorax sp. IOR16]|uniref:hypothetical protein n=1 Tax=Anaerovorax sp. IOR16 TaxID=2773458 RepID=UPI0019D25B15|nr:hypothetical protein [Anaerovorax sp. IOR16]
MRLFKCKHKYEKENSIAKYYKIYFSPYLNGKDCIYGYKVYKCLRCGYSIHKMVYRRDLPVCTISKTERTNIISSEINKMKRFGFISELDYTCGL